jgi:hypothetical protein
MLVGDGELRSEIEALISRYKLQDRVRITGWIRGTEMRKQTQPAGEVETLADTMRGLSRDAWQDALPRGKVGARTPAPLR